MEPVDEYVRGIAKPRRQSFPVGSDPLTDGRVVPLFVQVYQSSVRVQNSAVEIDRNIKVGMTVFSEAAKRRSRDLFDDVTGNVEYGQRRSVLIGSDKISNTNILYNYSKLYKKKKKPQFCHFCPVLGLI